MMMDMIPCPECGYLCTTKTGQEIRPPCPGCSEKSGVPMQLKLDRFTGK